MNYALVGYGRMGRAIDGQAAARGHRRVAVFDSAHPVHAEGDAPLGPVEIGFEFTTPEAAEANLMHLVSRGISAVCGTTGWQPSRRLREAVDASSAAIVLAPNFSVGMNLFFRIVRQAAGMLARTRLYDPFVEEAHHRGKRDVPSGTARRLADLLLAADTDLQGVVEGNPSGPMPAGWLQVVSRRAGSEPGSHTVGFDGEQDQILLGHRARGREGFALGAVLAAEWVAGRRGWHEFDEVLDDFLARAGKQTKED